MEATTAERDGSALLVLDMQRDFLEDRGRSPVGRDQIETLITAVNASIRAATQSRASVVYVMNRFDRLDPLNLLRNFSAMEGSAGAALDTRILAARELL